jgi:hypothetical protein
MLLTPAKLPKIRIKEPQLLPESSGLYLVTDGAKRVWYIGQASNLKDRHTQHEKMDQFAEKQCEFIQPFIWECEDDLDEWERENVEFYKPPLNWNLLEEKPLIDLGYNQSAYIDRYREISQMLKELQAEQDALKPNIISILEQQPGEKIKTDSISAWITRRKVWGYSPRVAELQEELKALKKHEEETNIATVMNYTIYPVVRNK